VGRQLDCCLRYLIWIWNEISLYLHLFNLPFICIYRHFLDLCSAFKKHQCVQDQQWFWSPTCCYLNLIFRSFGCQKSHPPSEHDAEHLLPPAGAGWELCVHLTPEHKSRRRVTTGDIINDFRDIRSREMTVCQRVRRKINSSERNALRVIKLAAANSMKQSYSWESDSCVVHKETSPSCMETGSSFPCLWEQDGSNQHTPNPFL
jgi:hypothetical protein